MTKADDTNWWASGAEDRAKALGAGATVEQLEAYAILAARAGTERAHAMVPRGWDGAIKVLGAFGVVVAIFASVLAVIVTLSDDMLTFGVDLFGVRIPGATAVAWLVLIGGVAALLRLPHWASSRLRGRVAGAVPLVLPTVAALIALLILNRHPIAAEVTGWRTVVLVGMGCSLFAFALVGLLRRSPEPAVDRTDSLWQQASSLSAASRDELIASLTASEWASLEEDMRAVFSVRARQGVGSPGAFREWGAERFGDDRSVR